MPATQLAEGLIFVPVELGGLWEAVEAALEGAPEAASLHEARVQLLRAWRRQPHPRLADLVEACDLCLDRNDHDISWLFLSSSDTKGEYLYRAVRSTPWSREGAERVAQELQPFARFPDPALTTVVLELARAVPPQLAGAEAVWSAAGRVLVMAEDVRAVPSLERFLDSPWPYGSQEAARCCVPHLERAFQHLRRLPRPPALEVPRAVAGRLAAELAAVTATTLVSPMDPVEELAQLERYAAAPSAATQAVLADWLGERGDVRGALMVPTPAGEVDAHRQCLERRLEPRWLARAPVSVLRIKPRAGMPWGVTLQHGKGPLDPGSWPPWNLLESVDFVRWDDEFLPALGLAPSLRHLGGMPWHQLARLPEATLARLETLGFVYLGPPEDAEGAVQFLNSHLPALSSLNLVQVRPASVLALRPWPALQSLRIWEPQEQVEEVLDALTRLEGPDRSVMGPLASHAFRGPRRALQAETRAYFAPVGGSTQVEVLMRHLAPARRVRQRLGPGASWTLDPALEARCPEVATWWRAPAGS